jgi:2-oxoisovalerate dehydrogenase E1 component alpha subunit
MDELRARYTQELLEASKRVREEPQPKGDQIWEHVFAERDLVGEGARSNGAAAPTNGAS